MQGGAGGSAAEAQQMRSCLVQAYLSWMLALAPTCSAPSLQL
jgi:hypothetical protein